MREFTQEDIDEYYEDELEPIYCEMCLKRGYKICLGGKILMPGEPRSNDYENWLECGTCGWLCPIFQVEKEATVENAIETIEIPFESKTLIESMPKPTNRTGKKISARGRKRKKNTLHEDPEINELMRI